MSVKGIVKLIFNTVFRKEFPMLEVGAEAPRIQTRDHRGESVDLSTLRGRYVVLWFFPKADTPG
jgi:peroxiredoxin Q/BCP